MTEKNTAKKDIYGYMPNGEKVYRFILKNKNNIEVEVINYGAIITKIKVPDNNGVIENIVLGYDSLKEYVEDNSPYFGVVAGRCCNRIANGTFYIDQVKYELPKNEFPNSLHGGVKGFDKQIWQVISTIIKDDSVSITLSYYSKDGEEGYPGNLNTLVTYELNDNNALEVYYEANTDKKTIINLTQHAYFNLSGSLKKTTLNHELKIYSNNYLPVNDVLIPLGTIEKVENTPFDFKSFKKIGKDINLDNPQLKIGQGYDHCWVINEDKTSEAQKGECALVSEVYHEESGRLMEVLTDQPGIQFYSGNYLNGDYGKHAGLCLETQHFPDSPNQSNFPKIILTPEDAYQTKTIFKFSVK
ncbi:aldose epimerase family protein [Flagellimonas sp. CMM7]|uniref:aldose epimerase family protein n=1 Tax=Flagellimonas sp. CMM7 TaxID=2654676 RepID=UPI0013D6FE21|nr:aldose epimerase family protein [Flagellimonas sp. CMM7]UII79861.1 galactose mutarotase [Flagellimonas sp. CMM7]